jgi:hypothetical protein
MPDGLGTAVPQDQTAIVPEHGIPNRGFHAHAGCAAGHDEILDTRPFKLGVELGFEEAAEAVLVKLQFARFGSKRRYDLGSPVVADQHSGLGAVGRSDRLTHPQKHVAVAIG